MTGSRETPPLRDLFRLSLLLSVFLSTSSLLMGESLAQTAPAPADAEPGEDKLPQGAIARLGSGLFRHLGPITTAQHSPDGKRIISLGMDGMVRIWDAPTGKEIQRFAVGDSRFPSMAITTDWSKVVTGGFSRSGFSQGSVLKVWDVARGEVVKDIPIGRLAPAALALSPDGSTLFAAVLDRRGGSALEVYDMESGEETRKIILGQIPGFLGVAVSPDGKTLATTDGQRPPKIWDVSTGKQVCNLNTQMQGFGNSVLTFSPDGKALATADFEGGVVNLCDPGTGKVRQRLPGQGGKVTALAYSPDGKLLAVTATDQSLHLWDTETGEILRKIQRGPVRKKLSFGFALGGVLQALAFSPDGKTLLTTHGDHALHTWDVATGREVFSHEGHTAHVSSLTFSPDGKTLATGGGDGAALLWDVAARKKRTALRHHGGPLRAVAFSPDGKTIASGGEDGLVIRTNVDSGKVEDSWELDLPGPQMRIISPGQMLSVLGESGYVHSVSFSRDGKKMIGVGGGSAGFFRDLVTGEQMVLSKGTTAVKRLGYLMSALGEKPRPLMLKLAEMSSNPWGETAAFSADGTTLVYRSGDTEVAVCDGGSGKEWLTVRFETGKARDRSGSSREKVASLALSPDGGFLVTGHSDGRIRVTEIATGEKIASWAADEHLVSAVAVSPDGNLIASAGSGGAVALWHVSDGRSIAKRRGHEEGVMSVAFSPDGAILASGGMDGYAVLWDTTSFARERETSAKRLEKQDLAGLWETLAERDAEAGYDAIWKLAASPETAIPFLKERIQLVRKEDSKEIRRFITDLDHEEFARREAALKALRGMGLGAEGILQETIQGDCSPEVRLRVTELLADLKPPFQESPSEALRTLRAIQALGRMGTAEAWEVLEWIVADFDSPWIRGRALASIRMMGQRTGPERGGEEREF